MKRPAILGMTGAVVALVALSGSVMAAGPVFVNGSFDDGNIVPFSPSYDFERLDAGSSHLNGWTIIGGGVDWIGNYWQTAQGSKSLDLDGAEAAAPGGVSQVITTVPNSTYVVTFGMSGNPDAGPAVKTMTVAATGTAPKTENYDITGNTRTNMNWSTRTYTFVTTGSQTTLSFTSTTPGGYGPALDNIAITQTLATGANCKKGGWQTMVDSAGTSFRNQGDCVSFYATGEKNLAN